MNRAMSISILLSLGLLFLAGSSLLMQMPYWASLHFSAPNNSTPPSFLSDQTVNGASGIRLLSSSQNPVPVPKKDTSELPTVITKAPSVEMTASFVSIEKRARGPVSKFEETTPKQVEEAPIVKRVDEVTVLAENAQIVSSVVQSPTLIWFQNEVVIEFPKAMATTENVRLAIKNLLLSTVAETEDELLTPKTLNLSQKPFLWMRVLNENNQPIRYPAQAQVYADQILQQAEQIEDEEGVFVQLHIPMQRLGLNGPAQNYQHWVGEYADQYSVEPSLIYAIMETESGFNPNAISQSNAIGLMQLKADAAGQDVYQKIDEKVGKPSQAALLDSQNNIRMGTAYLGMLQHDYFAEIKDKETKKLLTIASYNGGLNTVWPLFGKTQEKAIKRINQLHPKQIYRKLREKHHSDETRRYLDKVLQAEKRYQQMLTGSQTQIHV